MGCGASMRRQKEAPAAKDALAEEPAPAEEAEQPSVEAAVPPEELGAEGLLEEAPAAEDALAEEPAPAEEAEQPSKGADVPPEELEAEGPLEEAEAHAAEEAPAAEEAKQPSEGADVPPEELEAEGLLEEAEDVKYRRRIEAMRALRSLQGRNAYNLFKGLSKEMQNNKEVAMMALQRSQWSAGQVFLLLTEELQTDKEVALEVVKSNGGTLEYLSETLRDDRDVAIEAVKQDGYALQYCSETLRNDKDVCTEAVKTNGGALLYCSETLRNDKDVCTEAVKQNGHALEYCLEPLRNDKDVATEAVKGNGRALEFCSATLRNDKDVVMEALASVKPYDVEFVFKLISKELQNDKEVAMQAVKQNGDALRYCSEDLRGDKDVVMEAVKQDGDALQYCSEDLRGNKHVVMEAARNSTTALKFALKRLNQDIDCLKAAGFLVESQAVTERRPEKGILSVKFGFSQKASNLSTVVAEQLAKHPEMRKFEIYNPNLYCKKSCDPNFTDLNWECRGTEATCTLEQTTKTTDAGGKPTNESCWRLSFRLHQKKCKETCGFMLQLEEQGTLGAGQEIETLMAEDLDLKVFRFKWKLDDYWLCQKHTMVNQIADAVLDWFADEERDTKMERIEANVRYKSKRFGTDW